MGGDRLISTNSVSLSSTTTTGGVQNRQQQQSKIAAIVVSNHFASISQQQCVAELIPKSRYGRLLDVHIGQEIIIDAVHKEWCCAHIDMKYGLIPLSFVRYIDASTNSAAIIGNDRPKSASTERDLICKRGDPQALVDEITVVLKEWWCALKSTYARKDIQTLENIIVPLEELMIERKKILSGNVPREELKELRMAIARRIDLGNGSLGLDMVIRDDRGHAIDIDRISVMRVYREHLLAVGRIQQDMRSNDEIKTVNAFSILIQVKSIDIDLKNDCELIFTLYDSKANEFIAENFTISWSANDIYSSNRKGVPYRGIFIDLGEKDATRDRLVLVVRVVRIAPIESSTLKSRTLILPTTNIVDHHSSSSGHYCRQPFAVGICEIVNIIQQLTSKSTIATDECEHFITLSRSSDDNFDMALSKAVLTGRLTRPVRAPADSPFTYKDQLHVSTQILLGSADHVRKSHPHLFAVRAPTFIRKMTFPEVISTDDLRNDMYVTLVHADLSHGSGSSEKNIEARLSLIDTDSGHLINDSIISLGPNGITRSSTYHSLVFYHDDKPRWNETLKLAIPDDTSRDVHMRITFRLRRSNDKSNKAEKGPFALAYARVIEGTKLLDDGSHELLVYKIESNKFVEQDTSYKHLPSSRNDLKQSQAASKPQNGTFIWSDKNAFNIRTLTCSSSLTHHVELLSVLKWKNNKLFLKEGLEKIARPEGNNRIGEELVKFMKHVLDAFFDIWADSNEFDQLIFDCLVVVIRLVDEPRYQNFRPILDQYVRCEFHSAVAYEKLLPIMCERVVHADKSHDKALTTLKALGYLMELAVRSREYHLRLPTRHSDGAHFSTLLHNLLTALVHLMQSDRARMTSQNTALKHLPSTVPHLMRANILDRMELTRFLVQIIQNFGVNLIARQRLTFLQDIAKSDLFAIDECRRILLPTMLDRLVEHMEKDDTTRAADVDELTSCAEVIGDIVERLSADDQIGARSADDLQLIMNKAFRPIMCVIIQQINERSCLTGYFAVAIALLSKLSSDCYVQYVNERMTTIDKLDFLMELLNVFRDLLAKSAFQPDWFSMICLQNKTMLKTLRMIMATVRTKFLADRDFDANLWREYFLTVVSFITQKDLQLETFSDHKLQMFYSRSKDMRPEAAKELLRSMWFRLNTNQKMHFIPDLIGPFLAVSLIDENSLRDATIPIFFDMMKCEFYSTPNDRRNSINGVEINGDFRLFADELIVQLDTLVDNSHVGLTFKEQFYKIMMEYCRLEPEMNENDIGPIFITTVDRLLGHLFDYRQVRISGDCVENGMSRTVELLKFYKEINQHDLYIRYVYKLYDLHRLSNNAVEAAFTLRKHAKCLLWSEDLLPESLLKNQLNRHCATHRQLKEQLLTEIATLFDQGEMWEKAIETLKQLMPVYETMLFEYDKLAILLDRIAALYRKIGTPNRAECEYFLVGFYGQGYPKFLRNSEYVFRGHCYERLGGFQARMLATYVNSKPITSIDRPDDTLANSDGRHMQIISVKPIMSETSAMLLGDRKVHRLIRLYYKNNQVQKFEYARPVFRKSKFTDLINTEITRMWIEKHVVVTSDELPTVLQWSQVTEHGEPIEISPLEEAINTIDKSNTVLAEYAETVLTMPIESVTPLGGTLRGILQANVAGGIKNYEIFFSPACRDVLTDREHLLLTELGRLISLQVPNLEYALYAHASRQHQVDTKFHESLIDSFHVYRSYVQEKYGHQPSHLPLGASINLQSTVTRRSLPNNQQNNRSLDDTSIRFGDQSMMMVAADSPPTKKLFVSPNGLRLPLSTLGVNRSKTSSTTSAALIRKSQQHLRHESTSSAISYDANGFAGANRLSNVSGSSDKSNDTINCLPLVLDQPLNTQRPPRPTPKPPLMTRRTDSIPSIHHVDVDTPLPLVAGENDETRIDHDSNTVALRRPSQHNGCRADVAMLDTTSIAVPTSPPPLPPRTSHLHRARTAPDARKQKPQPPLPTVDH